MDGMTAKHSEHYAAGAPARRARASAWTVFWLTAGTSVLYNCYHALVDDHMPWYTGVPEGVLPLVVAIGVLEFSGAWRDNKPLQVAAWTVAGGAMAWSAVAIDSVVHHGWALGLIGDTAALAAMFFLLNGPTAAQAVARVAAREAELLGQVAAGQSAIADLKARAGAEIGKRNEALAVTEAARADAERTAATLRAGAGESAGLRDALERVRADLASERAAREDDKAEAARTLDRAVKAARAEARKPRAGTAAPRAREAARGQDDMTNELRALMEFRDNPRLLGDGMGSELGRSLGVHPSTGRRLHERMVEGGRLKPEYEGMAAPLAGGAESRE